MYTCRVVGAWAICSRSSSVRSCPGAGLMATRPWSGPHACRGDKDFVLQRWDRIAFVSASACVSLDRSLPVCFGPTRGLDQRSISKFSVFFIIYFKDSIKCINYSSTTVLPFFFFLVNLLWFKCYLVWFRTYLFSGKVALVTPRCPKKKWALTSKAVATLGSFFQGPAILVC